MARRQKLFWGSCVGSILAVSAVVIGSNGHPVQIPARRVLLRQHGPAKIHQRRDQTTSESENWSGYAVTGANGSVTDVKSSWVVPAVNCKATASNSLAPDGYAAFWTGIDGWTSSTVEQIGTDSDCVSPNGTPGTATYYAWFEFYPQNGFYIGDPDNNFKGFVVKPGDVLSAEVKTTGGGAAGPPPPPGRGGPGPAGPGPGGAGPGGALKFTLTISDSRSGFQEWTFSTSSMVPGAKQSSAEWIAETPSGCSTTSTFCPLADFVNVDYGSHYTGVLNTASATVGSATGPIGSFGNSVQQAIMVNAPSGANVMADPSPLLSSASFSVAWGNAGP